jgi:outer membrane immunogenic protein
MFMRNVIFASAAILTAGSSLAADLPARVAPAPYVAAPIFTWTGFYVGANAGAGFNNGSGSWSYYGFPVIPTTGYYLGNGGNNNTKFTGGVQAGYNWQFGALVAGIEADINYLDRGGNSSGIVPTSGLPGTYYVASRSGGDNYFGTVRARFGYAFDRALIYATGGLAYGGSAGSGAITRYVSNGLLPPTYTATGIVSSSGSNNSNVGWTLGAGGEYAFTNNWTAKLEYLYVDLGSVTNTFVTNAGLVQGVALNTKNQFSVVRAGVNYKF